ncbi:MAG TPA: hypothetical protein VJA22_01120 [Patescibacteria group bacterium]|nr:hypothetical protein [Patescibacteria group bacterium]
MMKYALSIEPEHLVAHGFRVEVVDHLTLSFSSHIPENPYHEPLRFMDTHTLILEQSRGKEDVYLAFAKRGFQLNRYLVAEGIFTPSNIARWVSENNLALHPDSREWVITKLERDPENMKLVLHICAHAGFALKERLMRAFPPREEKVSYAHFIF